MAHRLSAEEAQQRLGLVPGWDLVDDGLVRTFTFTNFVKAFSFMTAAALAAEKLDHHPEWSNVYNRVSVVLTTHDAGGVTELDIRMARFIDEAAEALGAKQ